MLNFSTKEAFGRSNRDLQTQGYTFSFFLKGNYGSVFYH